MRIEIPAYAKVNFTLEVLARRGDGYHEIVSIMQTVSLHDKVTVEPADEITLCPALPGVAVEDNLAYRAAVLLARALSDRTGRVDRPGEGHPAGIRAGGREQRRGDCTGRAQPPVGVGR